MFAAGYVASQHPAEGATDAILVYILLSASLKLMSQLVDGKQLGGKGDYHSLLILPVL